MLVQYTDFDISSRPLRMLFNDIINEMDTLRSEINNLKILNENIEKYQDLYLIVKQYKFYPTLQDFINDESLRQLKLSWNFLRHEQYDISIYVRELIFSNMDHDFNNLETFKLKYIINSLE